MQISTTVEINGPAITAGSIWIAFAAIGSRQPISFERTTVAVVEVLEAVELELLELRLLDEFLTL